ncbi:MAG: hypothetical protein WBW28_21180, partial [Pseudolabrys sp.]
GFTLFMVKAVLSGRGDEVVDLAKTNLWSTTARTHLLSTFRRQAGILVSVQSVRLTKSASPVRTE